MFGVRCRLIHPALRTAVILIAFTVFGTPEALSPAPLNGGTEKCVRNSLPPARLAAAQSLCGPCHEGIVRSVLASAHATCPDIINRTRYLWGAQAAPVPPKHGLRAPLRPLPPSPERPRTPAMLVDDFLRANCLHCHLGTAGTDNMHRETGCAACHPKDLDTVPDDRCLGCHHANHAGGDYHGLFERDTHPMFQRAVTNGQSVPARFGSATHYLTRDVHAQAGLMCVDCHSGAEVMGGENATPPSCAECHGGYDRSPSTQHAPGIIEKETEYVFHGKYGLAHTLPILPDTPPHNPENHGRLRCAACHAQWSYGDFGLSVLRRDDVSAHARWTISRRLRRWEHTILGVDEFGRISLLRPMHQYRVSYVNRLGTTILDSVVPVRGDGSDASEQGHAFTPYTPHTTGPAGKRCDQCHFNPMAAGMGMNATFDPLQMSTDLDIFKAAPPVHPEARLLNSAEIQRLLNPSPKFRKLFAEHLLTMNRKGGAP